LAILVNAGYPAAKEELAQVQTAARALGLESVVTASRRYCGCLRGEALVNANIVQITRLALNARLPTVSRSREYVEAGCLMSYGAILSDLFRRAGDYVDKILHGARPADLPVEQPTKFEFLINLRTAKALGLTVPQTLITRADEVIE
jgi:putative ABC transport system substrate-binding protein